MKFLSSLLPVGLALCCLGLHRTVAQDLFTLPLGKLIEASGTLGKRIGLVTTEKNDKIIREDKVNTTPPNRKASNNEDEDYEEEYEDLDFEDNGETNIDAVAAQNGNSVIHFLRKGGEVMVPCFGMWWPMGGGGGGGGGGYDYYGGDYYDGDYRRKRRRSKKRRKAKMKRKKKA